MAGDNVTLPWPDKAGYRRLRDRWINEERLVAAVVAAAAASICRDRERAYSFTIARPPIRHGTRTDIQLLSRYLCRGCCAREKELDDALGTRATMDSKRTTNYPARSAGTKYVIRGSATCLVQPSFHPPWCTRNNPLATATFDHGNNRWRGV